MIPQSGSRLPASGSSGRDRKRVLSGVRDLDGQVKTVDPRKCGSREHVLAELTFAGVAGAAEPEQRELAPHRLADLDGRRLAESTALDSRRLRAAIRLSPTASGREER